MSELFEAMCILAAGATSFGTAEEAAIAGLHETAKLPHSNSIEGAGVVYKCGDRFAFTEPRQNKETSSFKYSTKLPPGALLSAIFHTHPNKVGDADPSNFSADDLAQMQALGVPSYLLVMRYGDLRALDPGKTKARDIKPAKVER